jgi:hypothetical protein
VSDERHSPALLVRLELEERPRYRFETESAEDEQRLAYWLARPETRRRLLDTVDEVLASLEAFTKRRAG